MDESRYGIDAVTAVRASALVRVLAWVLLLSVGRASVAVALGCAGEGPEAAPELAASWVQPAPPAPDVPWGGEAGLCLCACGCANGQVASLADAPPVQSGESVPVPPHAVTEHAPPTPVLPPPLRPPLS